MKFKIINLAATGHSSSECKQYGCPCMKPVIKIDGENGGERNEEMEHDDNRCDCSYEINDLHDTGDTINLPNEPDDAETFAHFLAHGLFKEGVTVEDIAFEDIGEMGFQVNSAKTGEPLYQFHKIEEKETDYTVTWTIDVTASSAKEAAEKAKAMMTDKDTVATVFSVQDCQGGPSIDIDLAEPES